MPMGRVRLGMGVSISGGGVERLENERRLKKAKAAVHRKL
jgi:hypothetical protein